MTARQQAHMQGAPAGNPGQQNQYIIRRASTHATGAKRQARVPCLVMFKLLAASRAAVLSVSRTSMPSARHNVRAFC